MKICNDLFIKITVAEIDSGLGFKDATLLNSNISYCNKINVFSELGFGATNENKKGFMMVITNASYSSPGSTLGESETHWMYLGLRNNSECLSRKDSLELKVIKIVKFPPSNSDTIFYFQHLFDSLNQKRVFPFEYGIPSGY